MHFFRHCLSRYTKTKYFFDLVFWIKIFRECYLLSVYLKWIIKICYLFWNQLMNISRLNFNPHEIFFFKISFFATEWKLNQWKILVLQIFFRFLIFETFFDFQPCMHVIGTPVEDDGIFNAKLSETSSTSTTTTSNFESISIFFHLDEVAKSFDFIKKIWKNDK